jgi:hypothetical protein
LALGWTGDASRDDGFGRECDRNTAARLPPDRGERQWLSPYGCDPAVGRRELARLSAGGT